MTTSKFNETRCAMKLKEFVLKIALLGATGVGKTSLINNYIDKQWSEDYIPTLGANIVAKDINIEENESIFNIRLVLWDIAGQEKYESVRPMYFQGCIGAILVYDITRLHSFDEIEDKWLPDFTNFARNGSLFILIGNKSDLDSKRKIDTEKGTQLANKIGAINFIETSAKTGENVNNCFLDLVKEILKQLGEEIQN